MTTKEYDDLKFALSIISGRCQDMTEINRRLYYLDQRPTLQAAKQWAEDLVLDLIHRSLHHPEE